MSEQILALHERILSVLHNRKASYSNPVSSECLANVLQVHPSYLRNQIKFLVESGKISVRRGKGGGYYISSEDLGEDPMKITIDGIEFIAGEVGTNSTIVESLQQKLNAEGRSIRTLKVDDIEVSDLSQIEHFIGKRKIEIETVLYRDLFFEAIEDAIEYLPKLSSGLLNSSRLFQEGNEGMAVKLFIEILEGFRWMDAVLNNAEVCVHHQELYSELVAIRNEYKMQLTQLLDAWERSDFVLIADLMEYELEPIVGRFFDVSKEVLKVA